MKTLLIAALLVLSTGPLLAQHRAGSPSATNPAPTPAAAELAALEKFLNLSDEELALMEQAIARIRAMSPAQREALRAEIAAFRSLPEPQRQQIRQGWGRESAEIQAAWREMMQSATPERRAEVQSKLQSLSPEARTAYRRELVEAYLKAKQSRK